MIDWAVPFIPELVRGSVARLDKAGFVGLGRAETLLARFNALRAEKKKVSEDRTLSPFGKSEKLTELNNQARALRSEVVSFGDYLREQLPDVKARLYAAYPEPSAAVREIAMHSLEKQGFTLVLVNQLWESGAEYQGFVARHLVDFARLSAAENVRDIEKWLDKASGMAALKLAIDAITQNLATS